MAQITQKEIAELESIKEQICMVSRKRAAIEADFAVRMKNGDGYEPNNGPYHLRLEQDGSVTVIINAATFR